MISCQTDGKKPSQMQMTGVVLSKLQVIAYLFMYNNMDNSFSTFNTKTHIKGLKNSYSLRAAMRRGTREGRLL